MLHVPLKHPYANSLSHRLLRKKPVSCKNIIWPETKCILVYDEKMPLSPARNIIHSALKMYWDKGLQKGNPCHELGVRNSAAHVHGHLLLDTSRSLLILFIFMISNVLCTHTGKITADVSTTPCRSTHFKTFLCPRTQVTFLLP